MANDKPGSETEPLDEKQLLRKILKNQNALHSRLTSMEQRVYKATDDVGEVSKRGQAIFEDVFKVVLTVVFEEALQVQSDSFITASDFHFDYLKVAAHPVPFASRVNVRYKDLSSDVELVGRRDFMPLDTFSGTGQLPFAEVAPRRFVARGGILMDLQDNGTIDGVTPSNPGDFPYEITVTIHGLKIFLQRVERQGQ